MFEKENCPMRGTCLSENVLCCAKIRCKDEKYKPKLYKGICVTSFKKCYPNDDAENGTKLSTEYQKRANKKLHPRISWSVKGKYKSYNPNSRRCSL